MAHATDEGARRRAHGGAGGAAGAPAHAYEAMSGVKMRDRVVSGAVVKARFDARKYVSDYGELEREPKGGYGFVGVVLERSGRRTNGRGGEYAMWRVGELKNGGGSVSVHVFGDAYDAYGASVEAGHIVAVFDAKFYKSMSVSVETTAQVLRIGRAVDYGVCKATKNDGTPCTKAVNVAECLYCEFHVPKAIKALANASRQMTSAAGKRNASAAATTGDLARSIKARGASTMNIGKESHMNRPGGGVMTGAPASSARAIGMIKSTFGYVPKAALGAAKPTVNGGGWNGAKPPKTMALDDDEDDVFGADDNRFLVEQIKKNHSATVQRNKVDKDLARQRAIAAKLQNPLEKSDPNDTSAKRPTGRVTVEHKPLPTHLNAAGLVTETVESMKKKLDREISRRKELEAENDALRRRLASFESAATTTAAVTSATTTGRVPMAEVGNQISSGTSSFGVKRPVSAAGSDGAGASKAQKLFGNVAATATLTSRYAEDAAEEDHDELMGVMDKLEERDQLTAQLALKRETKKKVWHCAQCRTKTAHFPKECKDNGHAIKEIESVMRYFKCKACNETNVSYDALLPKNCRRNGCTSVIFTQVTAADVTAACKPSRAEISSAEARGAQPIAEREALNARGIEHGFRLDTIHSST
jgi:minichromosome maintenance protein 10